MILPRASDSGPESTFPQFGFCDIGMPARGTPHARPFEKSSMIGFDVKAAGSLISEFLGGSSKLGCFFVPMSTSAMFCGASRNSIHFQAASWFLLPEKTTSESPAIVFAQVEVGVALGIGTTAHFPLIFGKLLCISPANQ